MPDMDAFERLVAREAVRDVGPVRPVDDLALFEVAARRAPQWSFASLVSASKLVVAGAIVALFGGLLLVGTLTQPSEERQPAAVTDSPAPTTGDGLLPGVDLVTEEVEPGVFRVLSDGVRDLSGIGPRRARGHSAPDGLAIGPDGAIWVVPIGETTELVRLGDPTSYPHPSKQWLEVKVGPDGAAWTFESGLGHRRLGGEGWSRITRPDWVTGWPWAIAADGTIWAVGRNGNSRRGAASVARFGADGWREVPIDLETFGPELRQSLEDRGFDAERVSFGEIADLYVDRSGDAWMALVVTGGHSDAPMILARYDGATWSVVDPLGLGAYHNVVLPRVGADGTMWVYLETGTHGSELPHLVRFDDDGQTVFSAEDGVFQLLSRGTSWGLMRVDDRGMVWVRALSSSADGVHAFDGKAWRQYLADSFVDNMAVAPDGNVWVLAADHLYVITPAAAEAAL